MSVVLRDASPSDFATILRLNAESVHFLSPLTAERLQQLHGEAVYHRVAVDGDGAVLAFLLAFREGCRYDSINYRWFAARYARFLYIDRVVVSAAQQGRGIGPALYADLFAFAHAGDVGRVTCEIDSDPPNPVSQRFHARWGFREVGRQAVAGGSKWVSLLEAAASGPPGASSRQSLPAGRRV